jgi:acyl-coenzyme A thioesterase PaaI-like protein
MPVPPPELLQFFKDFIPFNRFLGIQMTAAEEGWVRLELPFREEFIGDASRPALHGGVISTLIDTCGGFAVWTPKGYDWVYEKFISSPVKGYETAIIATTGPDSMKSTNGW